jgi:hypothetical protein
MPQVVCMTSLRREWEADSIPDPGRREGRPRLIEQSQNTRSVLTRRYGRRAETAAHEEIRAHPESLANTPAECDIRQRAREHHAEHHAAAAVRAYSAGNLRRACQPLEDAETINPRFDWSGYRAMVTPPPSLVAAV